MSTLRVDNLNTLSGNGIAADIASVSGAQLSNRNKVHNGDMRISQRYGTTAHTPSNTSRNYVIDRWAYWSNQASKASVQQVTDAPVGFYNSAKCTSLSAHTSTSGHWFGYLTTIEAQDVYDLEQGTANAKNFTLSFYVKSSVTGTWAAAVRTKPGSPSRSYPFNYTISSANTWERKTITIPGSTDGTWLTDSNEGICIWFDLGSGSGFHQTANQWYSGNATGPSASPFIAVNGATWLVTGVQLESGDIATSFEHRSISDELARCQRYYYQVGPLQSDIFAQGRTDNDNTNMYVLVHYPVTMRSSPATLTTTGSAGNYDVRRDTTKGCSAVPTITAASSTHLAQIGCQSSGHGWGTASPMQLQADGSGNAFLGFSAEF